MTRAVNQRLLEKTPDAGKDWRQEDKGTTEDEMVGWHHWLDGHEFEQAPGVGEGQESLVCWSPWGRRVRHKWVLNWTEASLMIITENCSSGITFCLYWSARKAICPKDSKPLHNMTHSLLRKRSTVTWPWNYMGVKCHQLLHSYKFMYCYLCLKNEWITHSRAGSWNSWIESGLQLYFFSNSFNFYGHFKYMQKWKEYYNKHQGTQYPVLRLSILSHSYFIHHKHINFCLKYYKTNPKHCIPPMNISFCCTVET